ncbi:MAG: hypothetical protein KC583_06600 [Myxococcales bacterium]|nr:hypothetical protein [Myxococcales bacterium]
MSRRRAKTEPGAQCDGHDELDADLAALDAEGLRDVVRTLLPGLDDGSRRRALTEVARRAGRGDAVAGSSEAIAAEVEAFAAEARRAGYAEPVEVDIRLGAATEAFAARDYASAFRIYRALLVPISAADIDLGQDELVDEVLVADVDACARQFVVAMYMTSSAQRRAKAVLAAIREVEGVGLFDAPLEALDRTAVEALPDFDDFVADWRALVEMQVAEVAGRGRGRWEQAWLREAVARVEGPAGLGELARGTRRVEDLRAWCDACEDAADWAATRAAFEEAAALVEHPAHTSAAFLDGAAGAAIRLGADDVDAALERAWRRAPTLGRLRRWLGAVGSRPDLVQRAGVALASLPTAAERQRALLLLLRGEYASVARLVADAAGQGWAEPSHPGPLVFPIFVRLLAPPERSAQYARALGPMGGFDLSMDIETFMASDVHALETPDVDALLARAEVGRPADAEMRAIMLDALRTAAEKRVEGVAAGKRRRHHGQAASLVVVCAAVDDRPDAMAWCRRVEADFGRSYPALKRAFVEAARVAE